MRVVDVPLSSYMYIKKVAHLFESMLDMWKVEEDTSSLSAKSLEGDKIMLLLI